jgi:hypothetical protein
MLLTMSGQVSELTLRMMARIDVIIISPPHHLLAPRGLESDDVTKRHDHGRIDF